MVIQSTQPALLLDNLSPDREEEPPLCTRDRLLLAIKNGPRLSREDAEAINTVVREAREGSLNDELHG